MNNLVSIIIPCYNNANFIKQSVNSALNQTYDEKEIIVVDDGSDSQTKAVLNQISSEIKIITSQKNSGQSTARNKGIEEASGAFIMVLDSDDYLEPEFCEKATAFFKNKNVNLVTCQAMLHFEDGTKRVFSSKGGTLTEFLFSNSALGNCAMFKKERWREIGGYDEKMRNGWEDWEFYIRLMQLGGRCEVIPEVLFNYRKRKNTTTDKANKQRYELYEYIFKKHEELYKGHYCKLIDFFLERIKREEEEKIKNRDQIEFFLGTKILAPIRFVMSKLK